MSALHEYCTAILRDWLPVAGDRFEKNYSIDSNAFCSYKPHGTLNPIGYVRWSLSAIVEFDKKKSHRTTITTETEWCTFDPKGNGGNDETHTHTQPTTIEKQKSSVNRKNRTRASKPYNEKEI